MQSSSQNGLEEMQLVWKNSISIEGTRNEWTQLVNLLNEVRDKLKVAEDDYRVCRAAYNEFTGWLQ